MRVLALVLALVLVLLVVVVAAALVLGVVAALHLGDGDDVFMEDGRGEAGLDSSRREDLREVRGGAGAARRDHRDRDGVADLLEQPQVVAIVLAVVVDAVDEQLAWEMVGGRGRLWEIVGDGRGRRGD